MEPDADGTRLQQNWVDQRTLSAWRVSGNSFGSARSFGPIRKEIDRDLDDRALWKGTVVNFQDFLEDDDNDTALFERLLGSIDTRPALPIVKEMTLVQRRRLPARRTMRCSKIWQLVFKYIFIPNRFPSGSTEWKSREPLGSSYLHAYQFAKLAAFGA